MSGELAGLVLAGGKSRRLGQDKARITLGGLTLMARSVELLRGLCPTVCVSGRDPAEFGLSAAWFPDEVPGLGPMGGIMTGLKLLGTSCLAMSCDLPRMDEATLIRLVQAWRERPAGAVMTTFLQQDTGYIESLVAIYEPEALPLLAEAAVKGSYKLSAAIAPGFRHTVPYGPEEAHVFFNINYPADLALLRQLERCEQTGGGVEGRCPPTGTAEM